jgi:hypothetical protein
VPVVELVYVHVDVPAALETLLHDTVKPVLGVIKEENETSPVKPKLVTVIVEVVENPAPKERLVETVVSLKSGAYTVTFTWVKFETVEMVGVMVLLRPKTPTM